MTDPENLAYKYMSLIKVPLLPDQEDEATALYLQCVMYD